jgi:enoyl-CoA hydratase/carnithine racemase
MDMILHGALLFPKEAGAYGLVHAVVPEDQLLDRAVEKLQSWLALPQEPWRQAKADARAPLLAAMDLEFSEAFGPTIRHWWSVESRSTIAKTIEKLKEKSKA